MVIRRCSPRNLESSDNMTIEPWTACLSVATSKDVYCTGALIMCLLWCSARTEFSCPKSDEILEIRGEVKAWLLHTG